MAETRPAISCGPCDPVFPVHLMTDCSRKDIDHGDTGDDHGHAENGGTIGNLAIKDGSRQSDQHRSEAAPNRISDAHGDRLEHHRQKVERAKIANDHDNGRAGPPKLVGGLQGRWWRSLRPRWQPPGTGTSWILLEPSPQNMVASVVRSPPTRQHIEARPRRSGRFSRGKPDFTTGWHTA